jgi:glucose-6-phosphate isomerase
MQKLTFDSRNAAAFIGEKCLPRFQEEIMKCHRELTDRTGKGNDFLGWLDLPVSIDESMIRRLEQDAERIRKIAEVFVVIGIGGSYLGSRAVIEALSDPFSQLKSGQVFPQVIYAGENLSEDYHSFLLGLLDQKDYAVAVISKSGTTTEPAVAFRLIKNHLEKKYGKEESRSRIITVTDKSKGALKKMSDIEGYPSYIIPDDVGGRYSVLTPVGLLPIAVAGFDIRALIQGAATMREEALNSGDCNTNPCALYAAIRNILYRNGKCIEVLVSYEPTMLYFIEWWKQLFGESEGKEGKGIFPAGVTFTADLHSMGQYLQEGIRIIFETVISIVNPRNELIAPTDHENHDGLNFLSGKRMSEINRMAELGTMLAHVDGGVPNLKINIPYLNENTLGQLIYFFEFSCALSGYALGINPFDQPGVEAYKKNMFALLGKPGFEKETELLEGRLK